MPTITCEHCHSSREIEAAELAPGEMKVRCPACGKDSAIDGLALLQEGALDLELDWGDRSPRPLSPGTQTVASAVPPARQSAGPAAPIEPAPSDEVRVSLDIHRADLASRASWLLLAVGIVVELASTGLALFDATVSEAIKAQYLPGFKRIALSAAATISFAIWARIALASRRTSNAPDERPLSSLLLAPIRPFRAQAILRSLTRSTGGPSLLPHWQTTGLLPAALGALYGWAAWSTCVIVLGVRPRAAGFLLEALLCLSGAAAYFMALRLIQSVEARDERERALSWYTRDDRPPDYAAAEAPAFARGALPQPPVVPPLALAAPETGVAAATACPSCGEVAEPSRCTRCGAARRVRGARMLSVLSQKPHARTYLAQGADGVRFVLKEMAFALAPDAAAIAAFEREAELLRQLEHPSIPRHRGSFQEGQGAEARFYLAQELVEGVSLEAELADHRYSEAEVVEIIRQLLGVLEYLHGLSPPILHRDLKPANIIRRRDGALVLVDFGAAREGGRALNGATLVGTFGYMPPEQLAGQVDETSDLYALGMTALHLLARRSPWELFADDPDAFPKHLNISSGLRRFLQRLIARRRNQRIPSARRALIELAQSVGVKSSRKWIATIAGLVALLALAGSAAVALKGWVPWIHPAAAPSTPGPAKPATTPSK